MYETDQVQRTETERRLEVLENLVLNFRRNIDEYHSINTTFNEAATRTEYIDPLLKILGWDINNEMGKPFSERDIVPEEVVSSTDRPDYTAKMSGVGILFIEAKKPSVNISLEPEPAKQVRRYGWNAGHKISVLTNFEYLAIYETIAEIKESDTASTYRYKIYHFEEYLDKFEEIYKLLSYETVQNGSFEEWTSSIITSDASKNLLDNVFLNQLNKWRLMIGNDLLSSGKEQYQRSEKINEDVQTFLNQLIFLRFAEDHRFETTMTLLDRSVSQSEFIALLKRSEIKYNSGIFTETDIVNSLSSESMTSIVRQLYYPESSYDFSVINLMLLGNIYENFLQCELVIKDNIVVLEMTKQAKIKSVVSTPEHMVRYIVKKALQDLIDNKSPEEIMQLRIADLAVGSGTFLIGAYDYIEDYLVDWYSVSTNTYAHKNIVPFKVKRDLIEKVLYGFDIDSHAVQLTKFSLVLRVLRNEKSERLRGFRPILPSLDNNIICGNSLVQDDNPHILSISLEEHIEINPMSERVANLEFDIVLGNPPYLKKEDIVNSIPIKEQIVYDNSYYSSFEMYDKYFLFVEASIRRLKENGRAVLLIPNKFRTVKAGKKLRKKLKQEGFIHEIVDFGDIQLFRGRLTYLAVVTFSKNESGYLNYGKVVDVVDLENTNTIPFPLTTLEDDLWFLTPDSVFAQQYIKLNEFPKITEESYVFNGIQSSKNDVYVFDDSEIISETEKSISYKRGNEIISIEKGILHKFYKPQKKEAHYSYQNLNITKKIIFPYHNGVLFSQEEMKVKFPNAWKYLESKYDELLPSNFGGERSVQNVTLDTWYQYGRTQNLGVAEYREKILVGVLSKCPNFNIDTSQTLFESGGTAGYVGIALKQTSQYTHEFLVAWLSHPLVDRLSQIFGSNFDGGYYSHGTKELKKLPILPIDFSNKEEKAYFNQINSLVKNIYTMESRLNSIYDSTSRRNIINRRKLTIKRVNKIIDKLLEMKGIKFEDE